MSVSLPTIVLIAADANNAILSINNIEKCDMAIGHVLSEYSRNKVRIYLLTTENCAMSCIDGMHKKYIMNGWPGSLEEMKEYFYNNRKFFRVT
jgi:hypothetical protein